MYIMASLQWGWKTNQNMSSQCLQHVTLRRARYRAWHQFRAMHTSDYSISIMVDIFTVTELPFSHWWIQFLVIIVYIILYTWTHTHISVQHTHTHTHIHGTTRAQQKLPKQIQSSPVPLLHLVKTHFCRAQEDIRRPPNAPLQEWIVLWDREPTG